MPVNSLYVLAKRACIKNIQSITDVGDIPYEHLRPILIKISNPEQLRDLERTSPHLQESDSELWTDFIKRDVPDGLEKLAAYERPASYKIWRRLCKQERENMERDAKALEESMNAHKMAAAARASTIVDASKLPKLPRTGGMRVERNRTPGLVKHSGGDPSLLSFGSGSKTRTSTGQGVISKARREAREMSLFSARKSALAVPTHKLGNKSSWISSAPKGLLEDHKKPEVRKTTIMVPKSSTQASPARKSVPPSASSPPAQPPGGYRIPRQGVKREKVVSSSSDEERPAKPPPMRRKAPVDPFMPAKRRRPV